jgi:metal-responsive CopG/Arc/MetJ family transcriptional regulator
MKPIQVLLDERLIDELDRAARRARLDRSKIVRTALVKWLADERRRHREGQLRRGYERRPDDREDLTLWESIQSWPEE